MEKLLLNTEYVSEVFDHDWRGAVIYPENAKNINFAVSNEIRINGDSLCFRIVLKIQKNEHQSQAESEKICLSWCKREFPAYFQSRSYWNFFEATWIDIPQDYPEYETEKLSYIELDVILSENLRETILRDLDYLRNIRTVFDTAKERLTDLAFHSTSFGFAQSLGEARQHFRIIEDVVGCSADIGSYGPGDIRSAVRDYEELARRKIENNHNYQVALNDLRTIVSGVHFPHCWGKRPRVYT